VQAQYHPALLLQIGVVCGSLHDVVNQYLIKISCFVSLVSCKLFINSVLTQNLVLVVSFVWHPRETKHNALKPITISKLP
jgi:hypothetical protein